MVYIKHESTYSIAAWGDVWMITEAMHNTSKNRDNQICSGKIWETCELHTQPRAHMKTLTHRSTCCLQKWFNDQQPEWLL